MSELITDTIRFLIGFVHIMAASTWFAGSLVSLNISTLTKLNKNFDQIFQYFIQWTNTIISTLVLTGVILILDSLAGIGSKLYVSILTFKLLLFMWISIILYLNKYKSNYFKKSNIYNKIFKLVLQSKLIFPITIIIFLLSELLNIIRI